MVQKGANEGANASDYIVFCDIDGVLADFVRAYSTLGNLMFDTPIVDTQSIQAWDGFPMSPEQKAGAWAHIRAHPEWWATLRALETYDAVKELEEACPNLYFVTNRPVGALAATRDWLYGLGLVNPNAILLSGNKADLATVMHPCCALDDDRQTLERYYLWGLTHDSVFETVCYDRPYNKNVRDCSGASLPIQRVSSLRQFTELAVKTMCAVSRR